MNKYLLSLTNPIFFFESNNLLIKISPSSDAISVSNFKSFMESALMNAEFTEDWIASESSIRSIILFFESSFRLNL